MARQVTNDKLLLIQQSPIPYSNKTCQISMIDTTLKMYVKTSTLLHPEIKGHENLNLPAYAYLIRHNDTGMRLLFDAGPRKDWWNYPPSTLASIENVLPGIQVEKDILEILAEGGIDPSLISTVIVSHWHWDHIGNMSLFPKSTEVIVGPGFKDAFEPYYPGNPTAPIHSYEFEGRKITEAKFDAGFAIGPYAAIDHFHDGSLYLLNIPGHAIGHIGALVRTTPETFLFLAGDVTHFTGAFRPTHLQPMPDMIPRHDEFDNLAGKARRREAFTCCHPCPQQGHLQPYYRPSTASDSWYIYPAQAQDSIDKAATLDARPDILTALAHDPSLGQVLPKFPDGDLNNWMAEGWKEKIFWAFLNELPLDGKPGQQPITDGLYRDGVKLRGWQDVP